ncbi:YraN family protein [Nocardioides sp. SYSU DS0663]|uniref:YraN family protein n=1 Tax=Nocardioides sp. SYSU DS0663 TaxID=3416445 RepID=UPI003F4BB35C
MTTTAARNHAVGQYGETLAARHLVAGGMAVLDRNWRCAQGEIDLVLRDGRTVVVCEVKTRTGRIGGTPHEAVTDLKVRRLRRLAVRWLEEHGVPHLEARIDMVCVQLPRRGAAEIEHVRGIG